MLKLLQKPAALKLAVLNMYNNNVITYAGMFVRYFTICACCLSDSCDDAGHSGNVIIGNDLRLLPPETHTSHQSIQPLFM